MEQALFANALDGLSPLVALTGMFLGIAIAVQAVQEIYKFLTSSKARAYQNELVDFAGPWIRELATTGAASQLHVRTPFQWFKSRPQGLLLPLKKEQLLEAVDQMMTDWTSLALKTLKREKRLQQGEPKAPSPNFLKLVRNLQDCVPQVPGYRNASDVVEFFETWGVVSVEKDSETGRWTLNTGSERPLDANHILEAFYQRFLPERLELDDGFDQLNANFEYAYKRRNLRQTFIFGVLVAVLFCLPFDELYRMSDRLSPEEAVMLAERMNTLYEERQARSEPSQGLKDSVEELNKVVAALLSEQESATPYYLRGVNRMRESAGDPAGFLKYLFNCLVTAVFVAFGAPFWHRLSKALVSRRRPSSAEPDGKGG